jgi:hypothetical protein
MAFWQSRQNILDPRMALYDSVYDEQRKIYAQQFHPVPQYGAGHHGKLHPQAPAAHGLGARRRLDAQSIFLGVTVPVLLFVGTFVVMSFKLFYAHTTASLLLVSLGFLFVLTLSALSFYTIKNWKRTGMKTWHLFLVLTGFLACVLGLILGYLNFTMNASRYYDYVSLRRVVNVDPGEIQGQQVLDAGEIDFKMGTKIDRQLNMMYYKTQGWCVAPIISRDGAPLASYDFWAVGKDCCSSRQGDFSCGYVWTSWDNSGTTPSGLRVLDDADIAGYKLAVEQASSAYNIQVNRPIFLNMMKTPYVLIRSYWTKAMNFTYGCVIAFVALQIGLTALQAYLFGKGANAGFSPAVNEYFAQGGSSGHPDPEQTEKVHGIQAVPRRYSGTFL